MFPLFSFLSPFLGDGGAEPSSLYKLISMDLCGTKWEIFDLASPFQHLIQSLEQLSIYLSIYVYTGFLGSASGKEPTCQCRRYRFDTWVGKIPWRRACNPTPVFFLENSVDRGAWWATVYGVAKAGHN